MTVAFGAVTLILVVIARRVEPKGAKALDSYIVDDSLL
jgi:hypothetical protein